MSHLVDYTLQLADNALIIGHRNSEWCGHGPVLEQDIAITNISLDLIGQARNFYQYAAKLKGGDTTEDTLAYLRDKDEFKNCLLVELPKGDWAKTILRQFFFSQYQYLLFQELQNSKDEQLSAIAVKSLKEVTYHLRWSSEWVIRLGDGTEESHERMLKAIDELWSYIGELFEAVNYEIRAASAGIGVDVSNLKEAWMKKVKEIFDEATLANDKQLASILPPLGGGGAGKKGNHTEYLEGILKDLQYLQRAYPGCEW